MRRFALAMGVLLSVSVPLHAQTAAQIAARTRGAATAPITVYEMSDFQCPFCRQFATETFPTLDREYIATGKIRWIFVNLPIPSLHPNAVAAAQFATCAGQQGKFWPAHDLLFRHQEAWAPLRNPGPFLLSLADTLKLSRAPVAACVELPATVEEIRLDTEGAQRAGAHSTPTFYVEGLLVLGAQPIGLFRQLFDSLITARRGR